MGGVEQLLAARSVIHLTSPAWRDAVASGVDVGGLFQHMGCLPTFLLHSVGSVKDANDACLYMWRVYSLKSPGMVCEIHETISGDAHVIQSGKTHLSDSAEHVY